LQHARAENAVKTGRGEAEIQDDPDRADRRKEEQPSMGALASRIDESEVRRLAELVARLSPVQQRVVSAVADGFRAGWLDPIRWERYWRASAAASRDAWRSTWKALDKKRLRAWF